MIFVSVSVLGFVLSLAQLAATVSVSKNNFGKPSTEQPEPVAAPKYNIGFRGVTDKNGFIVPEKLMNVYTTFDSDNARVGFSELS